MRANVDLQILKSRKALGARRALVGSLVGVSSHVNQHLVPETMQHLTTGKRFPCYVKAGLTPGVEALALARAVVPVALVVDVTIRAHVLVVHMVDQVDELRECSRALQPLARVHLVLKETVRKNKNIAWLRVRQLTSQVHLHGLLQLPTC